MWTKHYHGRLHLPKQPETQSLSKFDGLEVILVYFENGRRQFLIIACAVSFPLLNVCLIVARQLVERRKPEA